MENEIILSDRGARWLRFRHPVEIVTTEHLDQVGPLLEKISKRVESDGLYAAGYVTYEAAPAFDPAFQVRERSALPLIWFGLYPAPQEISELGDGDPDDYHLGAWQPSVIMESYRQAFSQVKSCIARGETYQVNYTFRLRTTFSGSPWAFFRQLSRAQGASYSAYVDAGRFAICSASPELFFRLSGEELVSLPMKGTAPRGRTLEEDLAQVRWLENSEKNRAENLMIVDMIRNDMGRIAEIGSVRVPHLFQVERYPTVLQMTSTVEACTRAGFPSILGALFPCASITGAPKVRTMEIISRLETDPRGIYTGCIGYFGPGRQAQFNVAIRTVMIDRETSRAEYGVGGGIVWDSESADEYNECQIKSRVLTKGRPHFDLLETLLWEPGSGYFLLREHLDRVTRSAQYFDFPLSLDRLRGALDARAATLTGWPYKVRLLVDRKGEIQVQASPLVTDHVGPARVALAPWPIDDSNPYLYHKTTHRGIYDRARAERPDCDDVLLWNGRGEVTEATTANLVVQRDGELLTPPVECGLLAGTFRQHLLERGEIRAAVITVQDLKDAEALFLINSVRRWRPAEWVP
jgi:para-aminobenzoate synthetase/4-amino-4-deoxychorismate lyase